ncbi:FAD-dependent oxidoreductase, partial [Streptomyces sp. 8N706]|uniref:FAD-dependent oxidoreductase n=1 Tax=Streptomyces sp. 8N706 TaxID=3457416 RepID=UPI003FD65695
MHTFCDRAPGPPCLLPYVPNRWGRRVVDPVIVVGAGPIGLSLALALTRHGVPVVVVDEGTEQAEARPART